MRNNQRAVIFIVIVVFMVSVFGSAILILADQDSQEEQLQTSDEIAQQAAQLAEAERLQQELEAQSAGCEPLPQAVSEGPRKVPDFDLPTADITELKKTDITVGTGTEVAAGDCVVAYYHGTLTDGTVFDSAFERGLPNRFSLLRVIEGWQLGVPGMKEGGVRILYIPSDLAYGTNGNPPIIEPDADLVFVVELVDVVEI